MIYSLGAAEIMHWGSPPFYFILLTTDQSVLKLTLGLVGFSSKKFRYDSQVLNVSSLIVVSAAINAILHS